jgi:hypothetical protein
MNLARASEDRYEQPPKRTTRSEAKSLCMHASISSVIVMTPTMSMLRSCRHPSHRAAKPCGLRVLRLVSTKMYVYVYVPRIEQQSFAVCVYCILRQILCTSIRCICLHPACTAAKPCSLCMLRIVMSVIRICRHPSHKAGRSCGCLYFVRVSQDTCM